MSACSVLPTDSELGLSPSLLIRDLRTQDAHFGSSRISNLSACVVWMMLVVFSLQMLQMVGVETLVLPAVPELLDTWTGAFGFKPMDTFPRKTLIELNLMAFPGTSLLHKSLPGLQAHPPIAGLCLL
jgi:hypothetical protein